MAETNQDGVKAHQNTPKQVTEHNSPDMNFAYYAQRLKWGAISAIFLPALLYDEKLFLE
jgi:hypothetical protein